MSDHSSGEGDTRTLSLVVNGKPCRVEYHPGESLMTILRERFDLVSPKNGCSPQGQCGCCTVMLDGKAVVSCAIEPAKAQGKEVWTLEGLTERERTIYKESFLFAAGLQCGFCIPGIVMRAHWLLRKDPSPSREEIAKQLGPHLCRCTGYVKIIDAIQLAGARLRGERALEPDFSGKVGTSLPKVEGGELVLGERRFVEDMKVPQMLYGALRLSDHPRALVKRIDVSKARALPGVEAVVTAEDVPGERHVGLVTSDWPTFVAVGEETRYVGDVLAAVAAKDERTARRAAELVAVDYEVRQPITDPLAALEPGAPKLHGKGNLLSVSRFRRGDTEAAEKRSKHVVRETFRTQFIEHLYLEPEACLCLPPAHPASPAPTKWTLYTQGQGVFDDRRQVASALAMPEEELHVVLAPNGGAFGGKEDLSVQAQAMLLAKKAGKAVRLTLSREESIRLHPKRHPITMSYTVGCDEQGVLTFVRAQMVGDKGAYASVGTKVIERAAGHATGAYRVDNVDVEAKAVYTNNPPCGAMRGFGANQAAFAIESCLDMLAEKVGIDGWDIRWRNALEVGDRFGTGQRLTSSVGLKATLKLVKDRYKRARYAGIACGIKNCGIGNGVPETGRARLAVCADGKKVEILQGYTEMGQGLYTICAQVASEVTGLDPRLFAPVVHTAHPVDCGMTTASRATVFAGRAVQDAAQKLKADLDAHGGRLEALAGRAYLGEFGITYTTALEDETDEPVTHMGYSFATQVCILDDEGRISEFIAAHDVGKVLNPKLLEGQLEGSIHMGLGFALTESLELREGRIVNGTLRKLGVLRAADMPKVEILFVEAPLPDGPFGAKGVGEVGLVPTAGAVANALYKFDGKRRTRLPMKDSPAARAMSVGR
ncbi:MAG: selenium-dependent xanthine dehydrogenase [Myxococcales bacterium]|nr:selenium-dependent xanthine dehydrogenase [Myxococcales bacterium]